MTRLPDPYLSGPSAFATEPDTDDPYISAPAATPPAELSEVSLRIPKLHEYMGVDPADTPDAHHEQVLGALSSGKVGEYAGYLRSEWNAMRPGTPGRSELYANMRQLEQENSKFQQEAERQRIVNEAMEKRAGEPLGAFEERFAKTWPGQLFLHAEQGATSAFRSVLELGSRYTPLPGSWGENLRQEREFRRAWLDRIEQGGDVQWLLGDTGSQIVNATTESLAMMTPAAKLAGTPGVYGTVGAVGYSEGLQEAEARGLTGTDAAAYAGLKTTVELGLMGVFGSLGRSMGFNTLEEALSTRARTVMSKVAKEIDLPGKISQLAKFSGGTFLETIEEGLTSLFQQRVEMDQNPDQAFSFQRLVTESLAGGAGRAATGAAQGAADFQSAMEIAKSIDDEIASKQPIIAEMLRGAADAEAALASTFSTQDAESMGPVNVTVSAPAETTDVRSSAIDTALEQFRLPSTETAMTEGEGEANVAAPATYPEGIDAALQRAQAEEFARTVTPEKLARLLGTQVDVATPGEVVTESAAVAESTGGEFETAATEALPGGRLQHFRRTFQPIDERVEQAKSQTDTFEGAPVTSQTDTTLPNFTELTGIEGASLTYQDAFIETLAAYVPAVRQPAIPNVPQEPVSPQRTREQIRVASRDKKIAFQKETIARLRREVPAAREVRQDWFDDVALLIQSNVPLDHQGSFIDALRATNSPSKFNRLLDRVDRWVARHDYDNAWFAYDAARSAATGLRGDWQAIADKSKIGMKLKSTDLSQMDTPTINASVDDLNSLTEKLTEAAYNNAMQNTLLTVERAVDLENFANGMTRQLGESKSLHMTTAPSGFRGLIPKFFRKKDWEEDPRRRLVGSFNPFALQTWVDSPVHRELSTRPEALMAKASEDLRQLMHERFFVEGTYARDAAITNLSSQLDAVLQSQGLTWRGSTSAFGVGGEATSRLERWRETFSQIGGTRMSRGEALLLSLNMRDPQSAEKLRKEGGVLTHRKRRVFRPVDEQFEADLANFLGDEGRVIADHIFEKINTDVIDPVNAAEEVVSGHPLTTKRNMFPRTIDDEEIPLKSDTFGERWRAGVVDSYGHLKARQDHKKKLEIAGDGIDFYMRHVEKMASYAAYAVPYRDVMTTLGRQDVKDALRAHGGDLFYNMLIDRANRQVAPERVPRSWGEHGLNASTKLIATSRLAARIGPVVKQVLAAPVLFAHVDPGVMAAAQKRITTDFRGLRERMATNPFAQQRYSPNKYVHEFTNGLVANTGYFRPTPVTDRLVTPMTLAEREGTGILKQALAEEAVSRRMEATDPGFRDEVNKEWFRLTVRAENNAEGMELNSIQAYARDHALAAPFVMFSSSAGRAYTTFVQGLDELREGKFSSGGRKMGAVLATVVAEAMVDDLLSWEDVPGDWVERITKRAVVGLSGLNVATREIIPNLARALLGMQVYHDDAVPQAGVLQDAGMIVAQLANAATAEGATDKEYSRVVAAIQRIAKTLVPGFGGGKDLARRVSEGKPLPGLAKELESEWNYK